MKKLIAILTLGIFAVILVTSAVVAEDKKRGGRYL